MQYELEGIALFSDDINFTKRTIKIRDSQQKNFPLNSGVNLFVTATFSHRVLEFNQFTRVLVYNV